MGRAIVLAPLGIFFLGALGSWAPDAQAALVPIERLSSISVVGYSCSLSCYMGLEPASTISDARQTMDSIEFDETLTLPNAGTTRATQHSSLGEYSVQVFNSVSAAQATTEFGYNESLASFTLEFFIDGPVSFALTGSLALNGLTSSASTSARLTGAGVDIERSLSGCCGPIDEALAIYEMGLLPPGSYTLSVLSRDRSDSIAGFIGGLDTATASIDLTLTPVPLPMSALLLPLGLGMLRAMRLRAKRAAAANGDFSVASNQRVSGGSYSSVLTGVPGISRSS